MLDKDALAMKPATKRAIAKTLTYRAVCVVWIFAIAYILTHDVLSGIFWTVVHQVVLTAFYFVHEEAWDRWSSKNG